MLLFCKKGNVSFVYTEGAGLKTGTQKLVPFWLQLQGSTHFFNDLVTNFANKFYLWMN